MNIGVIGSGGREHALCFKLSQSERVNKIYCFPGNAGTKNIATNVSISADDFGSLYQFVKKESIELIIVGPEIPLVNGIVDFFESKNIKIFGPNKKAAQLDTSSPVPRSPEGILLIRIFLKSSLILSVISV